MSNLTYRTLALKFGKVDESTGTWVGHFDSEQLTNLVSFIMQQYADQVRQAGEHFVQLSPSEPAKTAVREFMLFLSEHHLL